MEVATPGMLVLPYTASSVGVARRRLISDLLAASACENAACDAGLVVSELISNALRHATPLPGNCIKVSWQLRWDSVRLAVSDGGGQTLPQVHQPTNSALGGRGLGIVDRLALRWGVCSADDDVADEESLSSAAQLSSEAQVPPEAEVAPDALDARMDITTVWAELPVKYANVHHLVIASSLDA
jgi:anti-sigma regulatory factor (Ser/Thr protein kinase)